MLDIGGANSLPPTIVVGRTLSAYDVPDVQNNQETLTFTVYNQAADPISGVLLTDTLESGVTIDSASQLPDQNGQQLAWSLGTIQPYDRASVTLTVSLATPTPTQLDSGASAYGTLDAGMVSWTTAPATLRTTAIAVNLLASTPDANTTDPYVQEKAAELNYDPTQIYAFLQNDIGYNSYVGSVRGARGTLWSSAGNSLDDASLGVALMRSSGIPAQYEEGTLSTAQAQRLILSMFPASYQTVGYIPAGTQTSDPADDPQLLAETQDHFWFQFDAGSGMTDADPEFAGLALGQAAATSANSFTEVPDNLRQTTEVSLTAEIYSQAVAAFAPTVSPFTDTVVLDQTFNDVDLVGHPLTFGNLVSQSGLGGSFTSVTNTYSPYVEIGDDALPDNSNNQLIRGNDFQEVLTTFPLGSQVLTGLFLNVTQSGDGTQSQTYTKTLYDRIGYATREDGGPVSVTASPTSPPAVSGLDLTTLLISAASEPASVLTARQAELATLSSELSAALAATTGAGQSGTQATADDNAYTLAQQVQAQSLAVFGTAFLAASAELSARTQALSFTSVYCASPRIVAVTGSDTSGSNASQASDELDLVNDSAQVVVAPGQSAGVEQDVNLTRGLLDSDLEAQVMGGTSSSRATSSFGIFSQALSNGIPLSFITKANLSSLSTLPLSAEAKARITASVLEGLDVLTPSSMVQLPDGSSTVAWLQMDPSDGDSIFMSENGGHDAIVEYGGLRINIPQAVLEEQVTIEEADLAGEAEAENLISMIKKAKADANQGPPPIGLGVKVVPQAPNVASELDSLLPESGGNLALAIFKSGLLLSIRLAELDPPVPGFVLQPSVTSPPNSATIRGSVAPTIQPGSVTGTLQDGNVLAQGALSASWSGDATSSFLATSLTATLAAVKDASGNSIGDGSLNLLAAGSIPLAITGSASYTVTGTGSLSFYGPSENTLGVSGNWDSYSATITGSASMTLTVADGALTLNGQPLPAGTYTITTNRATLSGIGTTSSPDFAGSASVTASGGAVELGPGSGNLTVGGASINTANETTLTGYSGTINVSANGNGTDTVTLGGSATNVLTVSPSPAALTTDQNTAVSFNANVQTSFPDAYDLTADAPIGWTVTIDDTGKVTVTPAPGTQGGTYPIQVIAQSTTNADLVSQATVDVTVTPTTPGMAFAVHPDPVFTVPFDGAQVPSAFRAAIQNTGPAADTYNLTFSNVPAGWTIVDSGTSNTVPAGQTGILGLYLQPTGTQLPAPGTIVSFTVTATSATDTSITKTVTVSFTMPAITAATVTSNPPAVSTTPGAATTATITITNVGNVPYNVALATTTDSGLSISGLSSPGMIPVGQSVTETATLTPDAATPLNTTLNATVNLDQAAGQSGVSVVAVNAAATPGSTPGAAVLQAGGTPAPQDGFAVAGESVDVIADVQAELSQQEQGTAAFTVTNGGGQTVFTSTAVPVNLDTIGALATVDLGTFDTTGLAAGQYTIEVTVDDSSGNAIAGATGTTLLTVSLPVSASLSVDDDNQTPGAVTSTVTLNVSSNAVMGNVATDATATSVAVNGTLAYVAGTQDISVVDISNPASPKVLSTFGSKDLNLGGETAFNLVGVAGNDLIVASQAPTAITINVLVYSLANPQAPTLLGSAAVPYSYLNGMTIQGTTAYLSTYGLSYDANGDVLSQSGELVAVDFSNPATPVVAGALYNDQPQPAGHASFVNQSAVVNPQTLLVTGSTSIGANTQTGTGQVTVVNTGTGGALSGEATLAIPGTVDAVGIAIDGTHALLVGSTGGPISPFNDPSTIGLSGNVTLTLLDISNPANPTVIGTTVVTQNTFAWWGASPIGTVQAIDLGNGQFAVTGTLVNGLPTMLLVDASNPNSLATSNLSTNAEANGLALSNGELFGAAANGLTIYQAAALATTPVTVTVTVPANGVSIVPNSFSIAPANTATGANSETLTWNLSLAPGANQQITWQTSVSALQAEQVQPVVTAATVQFTSPGSPPRSVGATLDGTTLNVAGVPTPVSVTIPVEVAAPGVPAIANAAVAAQQLGNTGLVTQLNNLSIALTDLVETPTSNVYLSQAIAALESLISQLTNDPFLSSFTAGLAAAQTALSAATTQAEIQTAITNLGTALDSLAQAISDDALHGFTISLTTTSALALPGAPTLFNVALQNTGSTTTTYDLSVSGLPAGVTGTFSQPTITLAPGQSVPQGANVETLSLSQSSSSLLGGTFTVTATAEGATEITQGTQGQLTLLAESISVPVVTVTPPFAQAGGQVDVTAKIQSVVNEPRTLSVSFTVTDANGNVLHTDQTPMTVPLTPTSGLTTVDLGTFDTTSFTDGLDTITVTVVDQSSQPLPTATGQGNLTVGLPVTATISTNPPALPENTLEAPLSVTTTLTIDATTTFPNPLTLDGQVQTTPTATTVALYRSGNNNLAYVAGTNGIDIVDVSNPAAPVDMGSFGSGDIVQGGATTGRVATIGGADYLIVGTTATLNANQFNLLVYSLANPLAPTKVSDTLFNYHFPSDLLIDGTTLLVPTQGLGFNGNGLTDEYGSLLSIDLSNPAAPVLDDVLYDDRGAPDGGDTRQLGGAVVQSGLAYIASSTSTASLNSINPGGGRVLVVDDSNPSQLSAIGEVDIPGTTQALGIAIQGSEALAVSSTGGPTGTLSSFGQSGDLVLSLLDISNPQSPQLMGTTLITSETFATSDQNGGGLSVLSLGNGLFAVSGSLSDGNPVLLLVDPSDPNNIAVSASPVPVLGNEMAASGGVLYATSSQGLTTYLIGSVEATSYTASVEVPSDANTSIVSGSFNFAPTSITTGANFDTLTWTRQLAFGQDQQTFTWQTKVGDLAANEVRPITLGTSVSFVSQATPGAFNLPGTSVTGEPVIEVLPLSATVQPGGTANYDLRLSNPTDQAVDYFLDPGVSNLLTNTLPVSGSLQPNSTVDLPFQVPTDVTTPLGSYPLSIIERSYVPPGNLTGASESGVANFSLTVAGAPVVVPDVQSHGVAVTITPSPATAGSGMPVNYTVRLTNTGSADDTFKLSFNSNLGASLDGYYFSQAAGIAIPAGESTDVTLTLVIDSAATPGPYNFSVTATSNFYPASTATAADALTVVSAGVSVSLSPSSVAPGAPLQMYVQNTGQSTDTFNLALAGPAALVSSLATQSVTLGAGASQEVDITTSAANFAEAGTLALTATATSQTDTSVEASDTADLTIPSTQGVTASFNPATQNLAAPGATSFLLLVNNTGNTEDSYSATITGTTGPITASLIGLDGQPAQSEPLFILPGLSEGAILLDVSGSSPGQGTVTVTIQSLTNSSESTTVTATLNVASPVQMQVTIANSGLATVEGTTAPITGSLLAAAVPNGNTPATSIVYTVTTAPTNGTLRLNGQALAAGGTFTQDYLNNGRLAYQSAEEGADSVSFSVAATNAVGTTGTFQITASDAALIPTGGFTYPGTAGTAATAQTVATFTDPGGVEPLADYAATIDWGDGTSATAGTISVDPNTHVFTVAGEHTYAQDATFTVTATLTHETSPAVTATSSADISAGTTPVLTLVHDVPAVATEGFSTTLTDALLATSDSDSSVTSANIVYTLSVAPSQGTLLLSGKALAQGGTFTQDDINNGRLTYQSTEEGSDSFTFSVAAGAAATISGTFSITASDSAVVATGGFTYSATEGTAATAQTVATFTDPGGAEPLADYSATIDWGDGTSATAGSISVDPNTHVFTVSGQHNYAQDGTFSVEVTVTHESAPTATAASTAEIANATVTGSGGIVATAVAVTGYEYSAPTNVPVATFTDGDGSLPAGDFSASITWGDGTTSAGNVSLSSGTYTVTGSHEYLDEGHYAVRVSIVQTAGTPTNGATSATVSATATVHEQLLENGTVGTPDQNWVQEIYRDLFDRQAETQGLTYWVAELAKGESRSEVAYQIVQIASFEEFQHDTVAALYQQYLGRAPDPGGLAYWSAYLYQGGTIEAMSQALVSSPEYYQVRGGGTVDGFLTAAFQDALGRAIDPAALTYFEGQMAGGVSAADVAAAIFSSDEYHRVRVNELFQEFLNRRADAGALNYFAGELDDGLTDQYVITQLLSSDEYYDDVQI